MATLIIQFSHSGLHYLNSFHNYGSVHFSTESLRQTVFPKMATMIAPILHDLTVWLWSRHTPHQVLGLFPHPHILNTGRHLWRPQTTEFGVMTLYYFWHRSSSCQVLLPYFLGILILGIHLLCCHEPKSLTETPPTHQLVKNSWCLFNMLTSFSNFLKLKVFLYTSRD